MEEMRKQDAAGMEELREEKIPLLMERYPTLSAQAELADSLRNVHFPPSLREETRTIATFYYCANNGGVEQVLCHLLRLWDAMGYRIILLTDRPATAEDYPMPAKTRRYYLPDTFQLNEETRRERFQTIRRVIREERVDVFVHHAWLSKNLLWDLLAVKMEGVPYIQYTHGVFSCLISEGSPEEMDILRCLTYIYPLADAVISLSHTFQRFWELFQTRSYLLCNPCEEAVRSGVTKCPFHLLWIGRIAPEKRPADAVKILHEVRKVRPEATLTIVGSVHPAYEAVYQELLETITSLREEEAVFLAGFQMDPSVYYQEAELLLCTSANEGFSLVIAEAKTYGVPCVMYDLPYLYFAEENLGIVRVAQQRPDLAANAVLECFADAKKLRALSKEALQSSEQFNDESLKNQWKEIFDRALQPDAVRSLSADAVAWRTMLEHLREGTQKWAQEKQAYQRSNQAWEEQRQSWETERRNWETERKNWEAERAEWIRRDQESFRFLRRVKRALFR